MDYKEIVIKWYQKKLWDENELDQYSNQKVLYQIYCDSHIYGRDVLAYIGMTDRDFKQRFNEHLKSFFKFANNVTYSIGTFEENWDGQLEVPESILIANHKPFMNKSNIHQLNEKARQNKIIIINNGNHGSLKNSCTNFWWVNESDKQNLEVNNNVNQMIAH